MKSSKPKGKPKACEFELVGVNELARKIGEILNGNGRLATITGLDTGERIEVLYHFETPEKMLTFRVPIDRTSPSIETITGIIPGAVLYEREIAEMLGVEVRNHPRPINTFIAEDYAGPPPLRKPDPKTPTQ
ncbi:MAG: NADH-quinone oxidoreductase subunit C [Candidatus Micrarchaeota archaeon]